MRTSATMVIGLTALLAAAAPAAAGMYNPLEPILLTSDNLAQFQSELGDLRGARRAESAKGKEMRQRLTVLDERMAAGRLTLDERIAMSEYLVRLQQPERALEILAPLTVSHSRHFMVTANLATANMMVGLLDRARELQEQTLANWPTLHPSIPRKTLIFLRRCEKHQLDLIRSRYHEEVRRPGQPVTTVDPLFPRARFVGPSGRFEVGVADAALFSEVPPDAMLIVQQLLLWMPEDDRLYWLLGELCNARGDVAYAHQIFNILVEARNFTPDQLKEHRRLVNAEIEAWNQLGREMTWKRRLTTCWIAAPRGVGLALGVADLACEAAWPPTLAIGDELDERANQGESLVGPAPKPAVQSRDSSPLPNFQHVVVSFLAGAVVALLLRAQFHETRRRWKAASASETKS